MSNLLLLLGDPPEYNKFSGRGQLVASVNEAEHQTGTGTLSAAGSIQSITGATAAFSGSGTNVASIYRAAFTGSGTLGTSAGRAAITKAVALTGSSTLSPEKAGLFTGWGTLTATWVQKPTAAVALSGSSTLFVTAAALVTTGGGDTAGLEILDPTLSQAPTAATVIVSEAAPTTDVTFKIDGVTVYTETTDEDGNLGPISIPVPESVGAAGSHTITATQGSGFSASATFTLLRGVNTIERVLGPDAQAVDVPGAITPQGTRKWILQDLMPGGIGSYVMEVNPTDMTSPHLQRALEATHTTAYAGYTAKPNSTGQYHVHEGGHEVVEWSFKGICPTQEMAQKLLDYGDLNRRFYVIDHRARAWKVTFVRVDLVPRRRTLYNGVASDWVHDYTVSAYIYEQDWVRPA